MELEEQLTELYLCDFSVFQSMLDHWAIGQPFPIMPIDRLDEQPEQARDPRRSHLRLGRQGRPLRLVDSDNRFLPVHAPMSGKPYYLGFFLMGAYQDIIGDAHNLFGRVTEVHVYADDEEPGNFWIEKIIPGTAVQDMLAQVQYFPNDLHRRMSELVRAKIQAERSAPDAGHGDPRPVHGVLPADHVLRHARHRARSSAMTAATPAQGRARADGDGRGARGESREGASTACAKPRSGGAQLVVLPELFRSRYFCQTEDAKLFELAEPVPGPSTDALATLAKELEITLVASLFEKRAPGVYHNTAAVLDGERRLSRQVPQDAHPGRPALLREVLLHAGRSRLQDVRTRMRSQLGVLVCWDQWYPEAARLTAMQGAEILLLSDRDRLAPGGEGRVRRAPARRVGNHPARPRDRERLLRGRGEPHRLRARSVGGSGGIEFWGQSFVAAPDGRVLVRAPQDRETVIVAEIDLAEIDASRIGWPFLRDRRIDAYGEITRRFGDLP